MIPEVPKAEWDSDYRAAMFRPIGPQIEIIDDADLERLGSSRRTRDT